jgi:hypothetical protein
VLFNALHRNTAGSPVVAQLLPVRFRRCCAEGSALAVRTHASQTNHSFALQTVFPQGPGAQFEYPIPALTQSACVVRLGAVYSRTGALATINAVSGYRVAIDRLNSGRWASGQRAPGFGLGKGVGNCTYALEALDDGSDYDTHVALTRVGAPHAFRACTHASVRAPVAAAEGPLFARGRARERLRHGRHGPGQPERHRGHVVLRGRQEPVQRGHAVCVRWVAAMVWRPDFRLVRPGMPNVQVGAAEGLLRQLAFTSPRPRVGLLYSTKEGSVPGRRRRPALTALAAAATSMCAARPSRRRSSTGWTWFST